MVRKRVVILGSTGSIGKQTLEIVAAHPERLEVVGLVAGRSTDLIAAQARTFDVSRLCLTDEAAAHAVAEQLPHAQVLAGEAGLERLLDQTQPDLVVGAISGAAGLLPLAAALRQGVDVALANKEPLVMAGAVVTALAERSGARLLPVDSELSAIFQCLQGQPREAVERILLTASGGPFAKLSREELAQVTPDQALRHPNWRMGRKVTIDSATLANKGFEVFEVKWLFGVEFSQIEVVVHHQSIIHSLVEFADSSVLAQLGWPDMRTPIQVALFHPERVRNELPRLDLAQASPLTFAEPDVAKFPCLRLARQAAEAGGGYPAALNGADEAAVELFLQGRLGFMGIPDAIERALNAYPGGDVRSIEEAVAADRWAGEYVRAWAAQ
ncbi:1-deoxy-D-xylulose-5-phosphate reductoisomerase [bacterium]|nr:1-deoxy-D-xylulose-5-phosphate reductoisomerase [bacterium]